MGRGCKINPRNATADIPATESIDGDEAVVVENLESLSEDRNDPLIRILSRPRRVDLVEAATPVAQLPGPLVALCHVYADNEVAAFEANAPEVPLQFLD